MTELKPCPFCGSQAVYYDGEGANVRCPNGQCDCSTFSEGANTWNTRPIESALQTKLDKEKFDDEFRLWFDVKEAK